MQGIIVILFTNFGCDNLEPSRSKSPFAHCFWLKIRAVKLFNSTFKSKNISNTYIFFTFLPALLLCKFIKLRSSPSSSLASRNLRAKRVPKAMSTLHPPHFHPEGVGSRGLGPGAHPHVEMFPRAQAAVTAYDTPALEMAYVKAASREPGTEKIHD